MRSKTPLTPGDMPLGAAQTLAWAMDPADGTVRSGSRLNQVILLRLDPGHAEPGDTRAGGGRRGRVHVNLHAHRLRRRRLAADRTSAGAASVISRSSIRGTAAKVVDGPAPRPLPALPLKIVDGKLVVAQPFTAPIGFEKG